MVQGYNLKNLVIIIKVKRKEGSMREKPCDSCTKDCVGGIIYGNCQQFLNWRREIDHVAVYLDSLLYSLQATKQAVSSD